jgi:uncharacterized protein YcbK (DUF882 family)
MSMSTVDWSRVRHFDRAEWVTDPDRVDARLVYLVDELREVVGQPIHIHVAWEEGGHVADSAHYAGRAVDLHMEGLTLAEQWLAAERFLFHGIGLYPYWNYPGLHLDTASESGAWAGRRWWRDRKGAYQPFDLAFLRNLVG